MPRYREPGRVHYLGRVRVVPGIHSPELIDFIERLAAAGQKETLAMLQVLLDGGGLERVQVVNDGEDAETVALLEDLLGAL